MNECKPQIYECHRYPITVGPSHATTYFKCLVDRTSGLISEVRVTDSAEHEEALLDTLCFFQLQEAALDPGCVVY